MKVRVQFYAQLRDLIGIHELELELPQGATVRELLEEIYAQQPALRAHDKSILIGAGVEFVDRNYKLNSGRGNFDHAAGARRVILGPWAFRLCR